MRTVGWLLLLPLVLSAQESPCVRSAELQAIYDADQADREVETIDWAVVNPRDQARRERVKQILALDTQKCPKDLYNAAMVFQHGDGSADILLAHVLATAAAARGVEDARWLSAAALDRYLHRIEQPQIFGTQYTKQAGEPWTQEPFERDFLSQALRDLFGVPDLEEQQSRLDGLKRDQP